MCWLRAGRRAILFGNRSSTLQVWELGSDAAQCAHELNSGTSSVRNCGIPPDNNARALSISCDGTITLWDICNGVLLRTYTPFTGLMRLTKYDMFGRLSPTGTHLLVYNRFGTTTRVYRVADGVLVRTFSSHSVHITTPLWSGSGHAVIVGDAEGRVQIWHSNPQM